LFHHLTDLIRRFIREKVCDPYHFGQAVPAREYLSRRIVVFEAIAFCGPNDALGPIVNVDDPLANDHAIAESYDPGARFKPRIDDKSGYQPCVQSANVA
jgi:hypothetical protein